MTDDERMDRARRIREMREGSRPDDDAQAPDQHDDTADDEGETDASDASDASDAASDADEADDADTSDVSDAKEPDDADAVDDADETPVEVDPEAVESGAAVESDAAAGNGAADGSDDGGDTMHIPGAEVGDVDVDVAEMARQAGLESADAGGDEGDGGADAAAGGLTGAAARAEVDETETGDETRVLEFTLGDEQYCLDIEYVEEIVKRETVTRVPNTPDCVEGVVDLRGQITTILDPKVLLDIDTRGSKDLIVVFDPEQFDDQGAVGWVVDDVDRVTPVSEEEVNSSPVDQDHINGVVDRDDEFVIWTTPELDVEEMAG